MLIYLHVLTNMLGKLTECAIIFQKLHIKIKHRISIQLFTRLQLRTQVISVLISVLDYMACERSVRGAQRAENRGICGEAVSGHGKIRWCWSGARSGRSRSGAVSGSYRNER